MEERVVISHKRGRDSSDTDVIHPAHEHGVCALSVTTCLSLRRTESTLARSLGRQALCPEPRTESTASVIRIQLTLGSAMLYQ